MRIVLIGQAAFGDKVLQELVEKTEQVVGIFAPPDRPERPDPLRETAQKMGLPVFQPQRMRDAGVFEEFARLEPDLAVMAFVTDIVPERILNYPRLGTIQYHPSLLPKHRGGSAINWPIIQGETKSGLTIFWPDKGIDTGPILLQREVDIDPDDTQGSLYFNKLFPLGVEALLEAVELVKGGGARRIPQDESQATYEGLCREEDAIIDWSRPAPMVYNLIRGCNPQPGATTHLGGGTVKIFDAELRQGPAQGIPGEVLEISPLGIVVAAQGGAILVKRVQPQGSPKIGAAAYSEAVSLKAGQRLGT